jgi:carboxyl-terminal processing protease
MAFRCLKLVLVVGALMMPAMAAGAGSLDDAYIAILRGDYEAGQRIVTKLVKNSTGQDLQDLDGWLGSYDSLIDRRNELKQQTLDWNVRKAQEAAEDGNIRLALSFASQAAYYAPDLEVFGRKPWMKQLTEQALAAAAEAAASEKWTIALNFYGRLAQIYPDDEKIEELNKQSGQHVRIEVLYEDEEKMREQIRGVDANLLRAVLRHIDQFYWEEPNFRKAARGGLRNLMTMAETTKLHEYLHGLGNAQSRRHFVRGLEGLLAEVNGADTFDYPQMNKLFNRVQDLNRLTAEVPEGMLVIEFLEGADPELDQYTSVIWPSDAVDFEKMMGNFQGVGIQLSIDERSNRLKVVTPLENSPAIEAGIQPEDLIIKVDGKDTKGWTTDDAVKNIMGPAGSPVVLTMFRPSTGEYIPYKLTRRQITLTSVRGVTRDPRNPQRWNYILDDENGIAYVRLTNFLPSSARELNEALRDARSQGMRGLVLDVRYNPGGLLDVAISIVSNFVESGEVVSTRGRRDREIRERVAGRALYSDIPLVVLVNKASASASEILAGALQDHGRAIVLGERTFGKGSVQHIRPLSSDARLKLTTALYYLPSGRSPHRDPDSEVWGVDPNWEIKLTPKELLKVIERERENYVIHNESDENKPLSDEEREKLLAQLADEDQDPDEEMFLTKDEYELLDSDPYEAPSVDAQLQTALLMIRVKLAANMPWPRELVTAHKAQGHQVQK